MTVDDVVGGPIPGMSRALRALRPNARFVGIGPTGSPILYVSPQQREVVPLDVVTTCVPTMTCRPGTMLAWYLPSSARDPDHD